MTLVHAGTGCGSPNRNDPAGGLSLCASGAGINRCSVTTRRTASRSPTAGNPRHPSIAPWHHMFQSGFNRLSISSIRNIALPMASDSAKNSMHCRVTRRVHAQADKNSSNPPSGRYNGRCRLAAPRRAAPTEGGSWRERAPVPLSRCCLE